MRYNKTVEVSLSEVIDLDLEGFLTLLEELWFADVEEEKRGILNNIAYDAVGFNSTTGLIQVYVEAEEVIDF